jgi:hypothetical protein
MGTVEADLVLGTGTLLPNVIEEQNPAAFNFAEMKLRHHTPSRGAIVRLSRV